MSLVHDVGHWGEWTPLVLTLEAYRWFKAHKEHGFSRELLVRLVKRGVGIYAGYMIIRAGWRLCRGNLQLRSVFLSRFARRITLSQELVRDNFRNTPIPGVHVHHSHTHASAAASRSSATAFVRHFADRIGRPVFSVQRSHADERNGLIGSRDYYWHKDLTTRPSSLSPGVEDVVMHIDVDYYQDMPNVLATTPQIHVVYTFQPERVAGVGTDYSFSFDRESVMTMTVNGGAEYKHRLWNYKGDCIYCYSDGILPPFTSQATSYLIERKKISEDRYLVMLYPLAHWKGLFAILSKTLEGDQLCRLDVSQGEFNRLRVIGEGLPQISTARPGQVVSATVPEEKDNTISNLAKVTTTTLAVPQVMSVVEDKATAAILTGFHRMTLEDKPDTVFPVKNGVRNYQFYDAKFDPDAKPSLEAFMSPIVHGSFAPTKSRNNTMEALRQRIAAVANKRVLTPFIAACMKEFVQMYIPDRIAGTLHPETIDHVYDRQHRPIQKHILDQACGSFSLPDIPQSFLKKESYPDPKAPRGITTYPADVKLRYSMYLYAYAHLYKQDHVRWYAFSKSPVETAATVANVCENATTIVVHDCDKMDGRINALARAFEQIKAMRAFSKQHHSEFIELHEKQFGNWVCTENGIWYWLGAARGSGSTDTSSFNTDWTAFIVYYAFRKYGKLPAAAWSSLGLYGGDDGITPGLRMELLSAAAEELGQVITGDTVSKGAFGVKFLSRYYSPEVWYGSPNSCADVGRQMRKFHTSLKLPPNVTPQMKMLEKANSFYLSDRNTPVLGDLAAHIRMWADDATKTAVIEHKEQLEDVGYWHAKADADLQYPNENPYNWMSEVVTKTLPEFDHQRFKRYLYDCVTELDDFLRFPLCEIPEVGKVKSPVVVDDSLLIASAGFKAKEAQSTLEAEYEPYSPSAEFAQKNPLHPKVLERTLFEPPSEDTRNEVKEFREKLLSDEPAKPRPGVRGRRSGVVFGRLPDGTVPFPAGYTPTTPVSEMVSVPIDFNAPIRREKVTPFNDLNRPPVDNEWNRFIRTGLTDSQRAAAKPAAKRRPRAKGRGAGQQTWRAKAPSAGQPAAPPHGGGRQ